MSRKLKSYRVDVKSPDQTKVKDGWYWTNQVGRHYVVARTVKDAISQAKRMAGYVTTKDRMSRRGVHLVEVLSELET